jgi:hypothetical protein
MPALPLGQIAPPLAQPTSLEYPSKKSVEMLL